MLEKFIKSLGFINADASNMNYKECDKYVYAFDDHKLNLLWRCFLAFYRDGHKQGQIDALGELSIHITQEVSNIK